MTAKKLFILALTVGLAAPVPAQAEDVTLTTYYPAPYGNYDELTTTGQTLLATDGASKVGIGTSSPTRKLHLVTPAGTELGNGDGIQLSGSAPAYFLLEGTTQRGGLGVATIANNYGVGTQPGDLSLFTQAANLHFSTTTQLGSNPIARMTITPTGNVGISAKNPYTNEELFVRNVPGSTDAEIFMDYDGVAGGTAYRYGISSRSTTRFEIRDYTANRGGLTRLAITRAGNVGIGTTAPAEKLDVAGNIKALGLLAPGVIGQAVQAYTLNRQYTTSRSWVAVRGTAVTINVRAGSKVLLLGNMDPQVSSGSPSWGHVTILRDGANLSPSSAGFGVFVNGGEWNEMTPIMWLDTPSAGSHTYQLAILSAVGRQVDVAQSNPATLIALEIRQ